MKAFIKTVKYLSRSIIFLTCNAAIGQTELNVAQVIPSDCDQSTDIDRVQHRIINQSYRNDTFEVEIGTISNCAGISDVFADYSNDTINFYFDHGWLLSDTVIVGGEIRVFGTEI